MKTFTIILLVGIPILLYFNAALAKKIRESHEYQLGTKKKIDFWIGRIGLILVFVWLVLGSVTFYNSCVPDRPETAEKQYSHFATQTAIERVESWQNDRVLRLNIDLYEGYVSPVFWSQMDLVAKEEFFSTILIYAETDTGQNFRIFEIKSNLDNSVLASYSSISGFDFIPEN